jgi:GDP-D-mannose dehydratase
VKLTGDSSLAQKEIGWVPKRISFKEHIERMCNFDFSIEEHGVVPKFELLVS